MSQSELSQHRQRLQRKLAASFKGWHSGRVDRLEEALRAIERELDGRRSTGSPVAQARSTAEGVANGSTPR
jgi:hypothetical protein